jgi:hypothetical protein
MFYAFFAANKCGGAHGVTRPTFVVWLSTFDPWHSTLFGAEMAIALPPLKTTARAEACAVNCFAGSSLRRVLRDTEQVFHRQQVVAKKCAFGKPARQAGFFEVVNWVCNLLYRRQARLSFWIGARCLFRTRSSTHSWRDDLTRGRANISAPPSFGGFTCWRC